MRMEMYTKVIGSIIKHMGKGSSHILMELDMRGTGLRINSKEMVLRYGRMVPSMKDNMKTGLKMVKANSLGKMALSTLEASK